MSGNSRPEDSPIQRSSGLAWALYDFAYSSFAFLFTVRFFPAWIIDDLHRPDWYVSVGQAAAVVCVVVISPLAGRTADRRGRRKPFLVAFTLMACIACAALGFLPSQGNVLPLLVAGALTVGFGQMAIAQFDPLLADVALAENRGRVSGLAVSLGFIGTAVGLAIIAGLIVGGGDKQRAFLPIAVLYLIVALPALVLIRERQLPPTDGSLPLARSGLRTLLTSQKGRPVARFLLGRFLYSDALLTVSGYLTVYMTRLGGFSDNMQSAVLATAVIAAAGGAILAGRAVELVGAKRPILVVLPAAALALMFSAAIGQGWTVWLAAPVVGAALGTVWTADRVLMLDLTPPAMRGEFFAFFNLANRVATAFGPLVLWSGSVWLLSQQTSWLTRLGATRVAVTLLACTAFLGWAVIRGVPERPAATN